MLTAHILVLLAIGLQIKNFPIAQLLPVTSAYISTAIVIIMTMSICQSYMFIGEA